LLSVPLQLAGLNLPAVYNSLVWLSFVAAGYGMYLLVRHLTEHRPAAFLAGVVFSFCPYHFAHMLGQLNLMSFQWMPLYLLALFKAWGDPEGATRRSYAEEQPQLSSRHQLLWASAAGLWFAVNAYTDWLYAMLLGLFTAWFIAWQLFAKAGRRQDEMRVERSGGVRWRLAIGKLGVQGGLCVVLLAPTLQRMWQEMQASSYMKAPAEEVRLFSADLTDVVVPNYSTLMWRGLLSPVLTEHYAERFPAERLVFVGYAVLVLGIVAVFRALSSRPRTGGVLFWAWTALGAWVLSLGPVLHVWGNSTVWGLEVPLPYALLTSVPGFDVFRVPSRIMVLAMLALAVLVGYALAGHSRKHQPLEQGAPRLRARLGYWLAYLVIIIVEFIPAPYPMMRQNYDLTFYREVAQEEGDFAILDLPMEPVPIYMAYQTVHRKPIVGGYVSRQPPPSVLAQMPVLRYLHSSTAIDDPLLAEARDSGLTELRQANIRYVIVHWWVLYGEGKDKMKAKLARIFQGLPSRPLPDEDAVVYQLTP
ncbi:MAG TPA: hypothetical protein VFG99_11910, partial [Chloroflexia bacterium]|nr:hypothetical protein [Chloroflexia bacterium]